MKKKVAIKKKKNVTVKNTKKAVNKKIEKKNTKVKIPSLSKPELHEYREQLLNIKEEVIRQMKDISEDTLMKSQKDISGDISGYSIHMADVATDNYEREFNLGIVSGEREVLLEIEDALKRIEDKSFGVCSACNKIIGSTRLKAIPYTRHCRKCQEVVEKNSPNDNGSNGQ